MMIQPILGENLDEMLKKAQEELMQAVQDFRIEPWVPTGTGYRTEIRLKAKELDLIVKREINTTR